MHKLIFLLSFLITITSSAQEDEFYVDDAKLIDLVTINYCVDKAGKTTNVKVVPAKTTYSNLQNIALLIDASKNLEFDLNSGLLSSCNEYSFRFINKKYFNKHLDSLQLKLCDNFKEGVFKYDEQIFPTTTIQRTKDFQIETHGKDSFKLKIEWIQPNIYTLTDTNESTQSLGKLTVEIIDILENGDYICRSTDGKVTITALMRKVK